MTNHTTRFKQTVLYIVALSIFLLPVNAISVSKSLSLNAELGYVSVLDHIIKFGSNGTEFNYVKNGGQDVLFPFTRLSLNARVNRNTFVLLYQPLRLESDNLLRQDLTVDSLTFPKGTPVKFLYNFPFYRFSYLYNFVNPEGPLNLAAGVTLQIRNTTISFTSLDGTLYRTNRDVGYVPALKFLGSYHLTEKFWVGAEADGIYAPVSYLNGDTNDVKGAILDASIRAGYAPVKPFDLFVNIRYLGGGAEGQSKNNEPPSDGFVRNWLHFLILSVGFTWSVL